MATQDTLKSVVQNAVQSALNSPAFHKLFTHQNSQVFPSFDSARVSYLRVKQGRRTRLFRVVVTEVKQRDDT